MVRRDILHGPLVYGAFDATMARQSQAQVDEAMKRYRGIVAVALAVMTAGCGSLSVKSDVNPSVDFDNYKNFAWVSPNPLVGLPAGGN